LPHVVSITIERKLRRNHRRNSNMCAHREQLGVIGGAGRRARRRRVRHLTPPNICVGAKIQKAGHASPEAKAGYWHHAKGECRAKLSIVPSGFAIARRT
jgi:hypothetical protein